MARRGWRIAGVLPVVLAVAAGCRKGETLPEVPGAKHVVPFSAVLLFRETPVSTREFEDSTRRWKEPTSPRFDEGVLRSRVQPDGTREFLEFPPKMAFRNRGDDCGSSSDRRICPLAWDDAELTLCGRPFVGQLELVDDQLGHAALMVCRLLTPAHPAEDGAWIGTQRDCSRARRVPLATLHPQDFSFRVGDTALVSDPGAAHDRTICERLAELLVEPPPRPAAAVAPAPDATGDGAAEPDAGGEPPGEMAAAPAAAQGAMADSTAPPEAAAAPQDGGT